MRLDGRVAIVTGGAKGIGAAIAGACAHEGAKIAALDLDARGVESVAASLSRRAGQVMALRTDVTSSADIGRAVEAVLGRWAGSTSSSTTRAASRCSASPRRSGRTSGRRSSRPT